MNDPELDSLVDQLKDVTKDNNTIAGQRDQLVEELGTAPADVEAFVIRNSSKLVQRSVQAIDEVKDYIMASGDPDSISALSELIRASSGAIESLNKIVIQNKRAETTLTVKTMDATAKYAIEEKKNEGAIIGTRDEVFKKLLSDAKVIDVVEESTLDRERQ